jgi:hypothetical protein
MAHRITPPATGRRRESTLKSMALKTAAVHASGVDGIDLVRVVIILNAQTILLEVVAALHSAGGFAGGLHGRQEEGDQDADDRDHDQQLDQRKRTRLRQ